MSFKVIEYNSYSLPNSDNDTQQCPSMPNENQLSKGNALEIRVDERLSKN